MLLLFFVFFFKQLALLIIMVYMKKLFSDCDSYVVVSTNNTDRGVKHLQTNKRLGMENVSCKRPSLSMTNMLSIEHVDNGSNGENVFAL